MVKRDINVMKNMYWGATVALRMRGVLFWCCGLFKRCVTWLRLCSALLFSPRICWRVGSGSGINSCQHGCTEALFLLCFYACSVRVFPSEQRGAALLGPEAMRRWRMQQWVSLELSIRMLRTINLLLLES